MSGRAGPGGTVAVGGGGSRGATRAGGIWGRLALAGTASLVMLLVLELGLRVGGGGVAPAASPAGMYVADPELGWRLKPGFAGEYESEEFRHPVRINGLGLRGPEVGPKRPGVFRLLVIGDSFTWGAGAGEEEAYPRVLERLLNGRPGVPPVEVINAGVPRYYGQPELIYLRREGLRLRPDAVVLGFLPNDLKDYQAGAGAVAVSPDGHLVTRGRADIRVAPVGFLQVPEPFRPGLFLRLNSALVRTGLRAWHGILFAVGKGRVKGLFLDDIYLDPRPPEVEEVYAGTLRLIAAMADATPSHRARFAVVVIPQQEQILGRERPGYRLRAPQEAVLALGRQRGIPVLDATEAVAALHREAPAYYKNDGHLMPRGYARVAQALAEFLTARGIVPGPPPAGGGG